MTIVSVWPVFRWSRSIWSRCTMVYVNRPSRHSGQEQDDQRDGVSPEFRRSDETREYGHSQQVRSLDDDAAHHGPPQSAVDRRLAVRRAKCFRRSTASRHRPLRRLLTGPERFGRWTESAVRLLRRPRWRPDQQAASPAPLCGARRATAVEDRAGRYQGLQEGLRRPRDDLPGVKPGAVTDAGSMPVVSRRSRADCGSSAAARLRDGAVTTGGCPPAGGDGSGARGVTYFSRG